MTVNSAAFRFQSRTVGVMDQQPAALISGARYADDTDRTNVLEFTPLLHRRSTTSTSSSRIDDRT